MFDQCVRDPSEVSRLTSSPPSSPAGGPATQGAGSNISNILKYWSFPTSPLQSRRWHLACAAWLQLTPPLRLSHRLARLLPDCVLHCYRLAAHSKHSSLSSFRAWRLPGEGLLILSKAVINIFMSHGTCILMLSDISMVCFPNTVSIGMPGTSLSTDISLLTCSFLRTVLVFASVRQSVCLSQPKFQIFGY